MGVKLSSNIHTYIHTYVSTYVRISLIPNIQKMRPIWNMSWRADGRQHYTISSPPGGGVAVPRIESMTMTSIVLAICCHFCFMEWQQFQIYNNNNSNSNSSDIYISDSRSAGAQQYQKCSVEERKMLKYSWQIWRRKHLRWNPKIMNS